MDLFDASFLNGEKIKLGWEGMNRQEVMKMKEAVEGSERPEPSLGLTKSVTCKYLLEG